MRKKQKQQVRRFLEVLAQAHDVLKGKIEQKKEGAVCDILKECQQGAIFLGNSIEQSEGRGCHTISLLEKYCELLYNTYEQLNNRGEVNAQRVFQKLQDCLVQIEDSVEKDIQVHLEVVFLPYKASMWDSLESVWQAADADKNCKAYVVPIPYYDKNPDGSMGTYHYEGKEFPADVPVMHYDVYHIEEKEPDVVYIHNPYDHANMVTSIEPRFYADRLKKYTGCLVYIPYYTTSGGMGADKASAPVYYSADYLVIQAEKYRRYYDAALPQEKLLPLGSPKFDRVVRMCGSVPEPPAAWKSRMEGKKVYFFNTSIQGMLSSTETFLKKMKYVFSCFCGREDVCLVWRPHPLLESTFHSMRQSWYPIYEKIKNNYIKNKIGIYDDTPDITSTVALCDAYLGDTGSSVISLFGIGGKEVFILRASLDHAPKEGDWIGDIVNDFFADGYDEWRVTQGNKLYYSPDHDYKYKYYCSLSKYTYGNYYIRAMEIGGEVYVCPGNAQDILVAADGRIKKRIQLERSIECTKAFAGAWHIGGFLFLIPHTYPALVKYCISTGKIDYIRDYQNLLTGYVEGVRENGGSCLWKGFLLLASPVDNRILAIEGRSGSMQVLTAGVENTGGCLVMAADGEDVWIMPYSGMKVTRWNLRTGHVRVYSAALEGFQCRNRLRGFMCQSRPFGRPAFFKDYVILPPYWGNMFLILDKKSGDVEKWDPPFPVEIDRGDGYYRSSYVGGFLRRTDTLGEDTYRYFDYAARKLYDVNLESRVYREIRIEFNEEDLKKHTAGFGEISEWLQYGCMEDAFNSLGKYLDGNITGEPYDKERQLRAYGENAANSDGTSGQKIHQFISRKAWDEVKKKI